jgi:hypothetical protein
VAVDASRADVGRATLLGTFFLEKEDEDAAGAVVAPRALLADIMLDEDAKNGVGEPIAEPLSDEDDDEFPLLDVDHVVPFA